MKHKMQFEKESRVETPDRKAILARVQLMSGNWRLLRLLALAQPVRPCHRHFD
jgi:hypothetical protein